MVISVYLLCSMLGGERNAAQQLGTMGLPGPGKQATTRWGWLCVYGGGCEGYVMCSFCLDQAIPDLAGSRQHNSVCVGCA